ncbi:Kunitz/Bovine pancreatic trypsin inhibitor domain protein [Ancylostoma caninum]|uniref:Kunitz/Bovine pancreatic trypsin inhibitor domain protein n=1 Tax=Ancylostoma caninum TaxID=29170 RepID=A0A368FUN1_ANCCA|nr:Kunitz/Bovine pancreatic trypsin inhibitor domain protein [Ancylostoma caninum]
MKSFHATFLLFLFTIFKTVQSFLKSSSEVSTENVCSLPPNPGYGDCSSEPVIKFYFDVYDLQCKRFLFLNCKGGNQNRFDSEEECIRVCHYTENSRTLYQNTVGQTEKIRFYAGVCEETITMALNRPDPTSLYYAPEAEILHLKH